MQNYPPRKKDRQPLQPRRGPERRWTASSPQPEPPDDQGAAPAPLVIRSLGPEIPVLVGGLVSRGTSPRPRARPAVNPRPAAGPVGPAAGDMEENTRSLLDLGNTARSSSKRPAPAARGPALVAAELFTDGDTPPRRGASSAGHRKSCASMRSPDSEQCNSAATRNPVAHSTARNATHSNPEFGPVKSATLPVSTARRSRHRESVRREIREHAEQAEARANAAYEQNCAALELISKSMDNVRNAYAEAKHARDSFNEILSVSSWSRHNVRRHQELRAPSVPRAERSATDRLHGVADCQHRPRRPVLSTAAARPSALVSQHQRSEMRPTSLSYLAESKVVSTDFPAQVSIAQLTPREPPRGMNTQVIRVHEWVADQRMTWSQCPAPQAPEYITAAAPATRVDTFAHGHTGITHSPVLQGTADERVSWLDQRHRSSTSRPFEPPPLLPLHSQPFVAQRTAYGVPGGSSDDSFMPTLRVSYPPRPSQAFQRQEKYGLPLREARRIPEYLRDHRAPTFEPVTPGGNPTSPHSSARSAAAAAILAPTPHCNALVRQCEPEGSIDLHNGGHNRPAQRKHPDRVTNMLSAAFISKAQAAVRVDTLPLYKLGIKSLLPAPYGGQPDPTLFENWLSRLLGFFRIHHLDVLNEAQDRTRLEVLGRALKGSPRIYFWERYQRFMEQREVWDFREAILDLRDRYLYKNAPLIAACKFATTIQGNRNVQALYDDLTTQAACMIEYPSDYHFRIRFMLALRPEVLEYITKFRGVSAEESTLTQIRAACEAYECSNRYSRQLSAIQTRLGGARTSSVQQPVHTIPNVRGASWTRGPAQSCSQSLHDDAYTGSTAPSHEEGQSLMTPPRTTLSAKPASQHEEATDIHTPSCNICGGPHYTEHCPPETWSSVASIVDQGPPVPTSGSYSEYYSVGSIPNGKDALSPESGHQGLYDDCGNGEYDLGGLEAYADSLESGSTQSQDVIPQPGGAPDPSAQAEGEPDWSEGAATGSPPPPYHEHDEYLVHHAHEEEMVQSFGSPQTLLEVHLDGEDFSAMVRGDY